MSMLTGEFRNTLDEKGRILFPAKLRSELAGNVLIVTQALDRCLWLFTPEEWKTVSSKLMEAASPFSEKNRLVLRRFVAPAQELEFDKSGRLSIPQRLRFARRQQIHRAVGRGKLSALYRGKRSVVPRSCGRARLDLFLAQGRKAHGSDSYACFTAGMS